MKEGEDRRTTIIVIVYFRGVNLRTPHVKLCQLVLASRQKRQISLNLGVQVVTKGRNGLYFGHGFTVVLQSAFTINLCFFVGFVSVGVVVLTHPGTR